MQSVKERLLEKAAYKRIPIMGAFELLPVCNLNCKMCYVRRTMEEVRKEGGLKDAGWWLEIAKEAADHGMLYPLLTGGEPFLHPEFSKILEGMLKMGLQVSINSNGTLINKEWADFLRENCPTRINITLYGASEESYQKLCGDGDAFRRVHEAVRLLKTYGIPVKFNASITPENVQDIERLIQYAKEQNSPIQIATYMFPPIRKNDQMIGINHRLSPEEAALAKVRSDYLQNDWEWFLVQAKKYQQFIPLEQRPWEKGEYAESGMRCRAGLCSLWVDWQGNFMNCGMYGSVKTSLKGKNFIQAWNEIVAETEKVRYNSKCLSCSNKRLCHSCIAMIYNECGCYYGRPEYVCEMNQSIAMYYEEYVRKYDSGRSDIWG